MLIAAALVALALPASFSIEPREASFGPEGVFRIDRSVPVVLPDDPSPMLREHLRVLFDALGGQLTVVEAAAHNERDRAIYIGPHADHGSLAHRRLRHALRNLAPPEPGAYNMVIDSDRVIVIGGDLEGTFYGIVALSRMAQGSGPLPRVDLKDYPALPVRGVSMQGRPTPELIRRLAGNRCNLLLVGSDDFHALSGQVLAHWEGLFDLARQHHVEPVPILPEATPEALRTVVRALRPGHVHIGEAWAADAGEYRTAVAALAEAARDLDPNLRLLAWADSLDPTHTGPFPEHDGAADRLPPGITLISRSSNAAASLAWAAEVGIPMLAGAGPSWAQAYTATRATLAAEAPGVVVHWDGLPDESDLAAARVALANGWNPESVTNAWAEGLNAYFGTDFWDPSFPEMLPAFIAFLNRETLSGRSPAEVDRDFSAVLREVRRALPSGETESVFAETAFRAVLDYVRLEADFHAGRGPTAIGNLIDLVALHERLNPAFAPERRDRVTEVIRNTGLFVPSTILLGTGTGPEDTGYLMPFRPMGSAGGLPLLISLANPSYYDSEDLARADIALGAAIGPVARVDFETVATAELIVAVSDSDRDYRTAASVTSRERGGVRAPVILERPVAAPNLRITAIAPAEQAVLKEVIVSAYKEPAALVAFPMPSAPVIDGSIGGAEWTGEAGVGFVRTDRAAFAEAQTAFFIGHDRDALYVAVRAFEPRMDTLLARSTERDANLFDEESIEVLVRPEGAPPVRLVVNALGTQYDALNWNPAWRGEWEVATRLLETEWTAEFRIPFATLGARPEPGSRWGFNVVRHRRNVRSERSAWQTGEDAAGLPHGYGVIAFNLPGGGR